MGKLQFRVMKECGNARVGELTLNDVTLQTPVFMPVGTKATIKGIVLDMLGDSTYIGDLPKISMILANTFHLYLRPGAGIIKKAGGLHQFESRKNGLILTDSGGFQVFSLGDNNTLKKVNNDEVVTKNQKQGNTHNVKIDVNDDGVSFCSPIDGSSHFFSPEGVVDIQCDLGSDIMMMLDVCSAAGSSKQVLIRDMERTHAWARRQYIHHQAKYDEVRGVLFPIIQGGIDLTLRQQSIDALAPLASDGIAVGGVSVGEELYVKREVIEFCGPKLPVDKPRYLMGIGTPEDILWAISSGFDMFDCVLPTRLGRHGVAFGNKNISPQAISSCDFSHTESAMALFGGRIKVKNAVYREDFSSLVNGCPCYVCQHYSRAYLHHLVREKEMLGGILLSLHNIVYLHWMLQEWRNFFLKE